MSNGGLNNRQFVTITLIIILCGIAILGHDYFVSKRLSVYEKMSMTLSQEPAYVDDNSEPATSSSDRKGDSSGDTSGRVKRLNIKYNYVGRLKIPRINLNKGFVKYGTSGNNVDQNIAIMKGSSYPDKEGSNFIIAGHNGSRWNAFFTNLDKLKKGDMAYVTYKGKQYRYKLVKRYKDKQYDGVTLYRHGTDKQLTLITCSRPDYRKYYLVLVFVITEEKDL